MKYIWIFLFLVGCTPWYGAKHPIPQEQLNTMGLLEQEWFNSNLPALHQDCLHQKDISGYLEADNATMTYLVGYCAAYGEQCQDPSFDVRARNGCLFGVCTGGSVLWQMSDPWPIGLFTPERVIILVSAYASEFEQGMELIHEYGHALNACMFGDYFSHNNQDIWGPDGIVPRAHAQYVIEFARTHPQ